MDPIIKIFKSTDDLSFEFAEMLIQLIKEKSTEEHFSLVLSGGSTPKSVFKYIATNFRDKIPWEKLLIFWGDERCVGPDDSESNFKMAKENLFDWVPIPQNNIFRIKGENDPSHESDRYSEIVKKHVKLNNNIPRFDLIMVGLGDDGHTASIFPGQMHLFDSNKLFDVAENPYSKQLRITATGSLINEAAHIVFLATGKSKDEMVANVIEKKNGSEFLPASKVNPANGKIIWLLDEQAASGLEKSI